MARLLTSTSHPTSWIPHQTSPPSCLPHRTSQISHLILTSWNLTFLTPSSFPMEPHTPHHPHLYLMQPQHTSPPSSLPHATSTYLTPSYLPHGTSQYLNPLIFTSWNLTNVNPLIFTSMNLNTPHHPILTSSNLIFTLCNLTVSYTPHLYLIKPHIHPTSLPQRLIYLTPSTDNPPLPTLHLNLTIPQPLQPHVGSPHQN